MRGLLAGAAYLQVAHNNITAASKPQVDERVGHEHARGIKHVGIVIGVSDNQKILGSHKLISDVKRRTTGLQRRPVREQCNPVD